MAEKEEVHHYEYVIDDENETKSRYVHFTNKFKTNGFGIFMHVLAVLALIIGFIVSSSVSAEYVTHQTVQALWSIKYIAYAIFFEVVALNCRTHN